MEPNTQEFNQTQTPIPPVEPVQKVETVEPKKNSNFLLILLSILLIIASLIAGFFAYQTQNLVKEITKLQPTSTPIASIEPSPTLDLIENWDIYRDEKYSYELSYPQTIYKQLRCLDAGFILKRIWHREDSILSPEPETDTIIYKCDRPGSFPYSFEVATKNAPFNIPISDTYYKVESENIKVDNTNAIKYTFNLILDPEPGSMPWPEWYSQVFFEKDGVYFLIHFGDGKDNLEIFDQILSTFKFIEPEASILPTTSPQP